MTGFSLFPQIRGWMWFGSDHLYIKAVILSLLSNMERQFSLQQNKALLHDLNLFPLVGVFLESSTLGMPIYISGLSTISWLLFELLSRFRWLNSCDIHPRNPFWVPDSENSLKTGLGFSTLVAHHMTFSIAPCPPVTPSPHDSESLLFWSPCAWLLSTWTIHLLLPPLGTSSWVLRV